MMATPPYDKYGLAQASPASVLRTGWYSQPIQPE